MRSDCESITINTLDSLLIEETRYIDDRNMRSISKFDKNLRLR